MISGNDDLWFRQSIEERARLLELVRTGALCEISGNGNDVGFDFSDDFRQRFDQRRVHAPEVQVREMNYRSHTRVTRLLHLSGQSLAVHGSESGIEVAPPSLRFHRQKQPARVFELCGSSPR